MCLNPQRIVNPSKRFSTKGFHQLFLEVPCGKCAECQERKIDEYKLRSYYEGMSTFDAGGFIIFDTLTYADEYLPHLSDEDPFFKDSPYDYPCFSYQDYRLFMVRLRQMAKERLGVPAETIKYFTASEYGTDERYTHRPHIHILLFIKHAIDPVQFSYLISDCWPFGRTDGVRYKGRSYFFKKRCFSRNTNNDVLHLTNVCKYVTKYLSKDSSFQDTIDLRLDLSMIYKYGKNWKYDDSAQDYYRKLKRQVCQFHLNSQKFGISVFKYNNMDEVLHTGMMYMKSSSNVIQHIPIPMYFKRKLFYELTKDFRGQPKWKLTPFGVQWKINRTEDSIRHLSNRLASWYEQLSLDNNTFLYDSATRFLGLRTWNDFAKYLLFYKDRLLPYFHQLPNRSHKLDEPLPIDIAITLQYEDDLDNDKYHFYRKEVKSVTFQFSGDEFAPPDDDYDGNSLVLSKYADAYIINEDTYSCFNDFDKLFNVFVSSQHPLNQAKQKAYDLKKHLDTLFSNIAK